MAETLEMLSYEEWKAFVLTVIDRADTEVFVFDRDKYYGCYCVVGTNVSKRNILKGGSEETALLNDYVFWQDHAAPVNFSRQTFDSFSTNLPYRGASETTILRPHIMTESQSIFNTLVGTVASGTDRYMQVFRASSDNVHDVVLYLEGEGDESAIDTFDSYSNDTQLRNVWTASDTNNTNIYSEGSIISETSGRAMKVDVEGYASVGDTITRSFSPALNFSDKIAVSLNFKASVQGEQWNISFYDGSNWCTASFQSNNTNYNTYYLLLSSFTGNMDWSNVEQVQLELVSTTASSYSGGTYYIISSNGYAVATGVTTNVVCGNNTTSTRYTLLGNTYDCSATRVELSSAGTLIEAYLDYTMSDNTSIYGNSFIGRIRDMSGTSNSSIGVRLFYILTNGTRVYFDGPEATYNLSANEYVTYTFNLSSQSKLVPIGARLGLQARLLSGHARIYWGSSIYGSGAAGELSISSNISNSYFDNLEVISDLGTVLITLHDFGSNLPASGTELPASLPFDENWQATTKLSLQPGFHQVHLHYGSHTNYNLVTATGTTNSGITLGNYYGITVNAPDIGVCNIYGCEQECYNNGAFYSINSDNLLSPVENYTMFFGIMAIEPCYITDVNTHFDDVTGNSNITLYIEDEDTNKIIDWIVNEKTYNSEDISYDLSRNTALLKVDRNQLLKFMYSDDSVDSNVSSYTVNVKWLFRPINIYG